MNKKSGYKKITYEERQTMEKMFKEGATVSEVVEAFGRSHTTIYQELAKSRVTPRNRSQYSAELAQRTLLPDSKKITSFRETWPKEAKKPKMRL